MNLLQQIQQHADEIRRILGVPTHAELASQLKGINSTVDQQLAEIAADKPGDVTNGTPIAFSATLRRRRSKSPTSR